MGHIENFQTKGNKNSIKDNMFEYGLSKNKQTDAVMKQEKFMEGLAVWVGYWRANPHRFVTEYLMISPFSLFQKILLFLMFFQDSSFFLYKNCHKHKKMSIDKMLLNTMVSPQSGGKKYGGTTKIGRANITKKPILYIQ